MQVGKVLILVCFWQGVGKADGYLNKQATMPFYWGASALEMHKDHWTEDNPNARFPRLAFNETNNEQNSSFWMANAAYLRLKNVTLGYTLPKTLSEKIKFLPCPALCQWTESFIH